MRPGQDRRPPAGPEQSPTAPIGDTMLLSRALTPASDAPHGTSRKPVISSAASAASGATTRIVATAARAITDLLDGRHFLGRSNWGLSSQNEAAQSHVG